MNTEVKFFSSLVKSLINISGVNDEALILDPMCGSGTAPAETLISNHIGIGADLNPLSVLISRVKCSIVCEKAEVFKEQVNSALDSFKYEPTNKEFWNEKDNKYLALLFCEQALKDIASILFEIENIKI
jgi:hypothetical protein